MEKRFDLVEALLQLEEKEKRKYSSKVTLDSMAVTSVTPQSLENTEKVTEVTIVTEDRSIIPIVPFPFEALPQSLKDFVFKVAESHHVDPSLVACLVLAMLSGLIGNAVRIIPKKGWEEPPFLWVVVVAPSGYGKSPVINTLARPIHDIQRKLYKESLNSKEGSDESTETTFKQIIVADTTFEALADVMHRNPKGVVFWKDEIGGLILSLNQYKTRGDDKQRLLELWNANPWIISRKSKSLYIPYTGAAIIGGLPPDELPRIFTSSSLRDGLMPRFLFSHLKAGAVRFNRAGLEDPEKNFWAGLVSFCHFLPLREDERGKITPFGLSLSEEALHEFENTYNYFHHIKEYLSEEMKPFIPKLLSYCLRIAGVLFVINKALKKEMITNEEIDKQTLLDAIEMMKYFAGQVVLTLQLYKDPEKRYTRWHIEVLQTLYKLRGKVNKGLLLLNTISDEFNKDRPVNLKLDSRQIASVLRELGFAIKRTTGGRRALQWDEDRFNKLYKEMVATVTIVTQPDFSTVSAVQKSDHSDSEITLEGEIEVVDEG
jgi:hypothetical protein